MNNTITFPHLGIELNVNRAVFEVGNFPIYWYGFIIACGLILAIVYGVRESRRVGLDGDDFFDLLLVALPTAVICARIYYVIFSWDLYRGDILSVFDIRSGGLAIYGGIIGAAAAVYFCCKKKNLKIGIVLDILAVGLLIGQSIGRWGNFVNGEAFGGYTDLPWAMTIVSDGRTIAESVHPTFLYESIWNAIGIAVLLMYKKIRKFDGELFAFYMLWYGTGRMFIEGLRADSLYMGNLRVSQILSVVISVVGIVILLRGRKFANQNPDGGREDD